MKKISMKSVIMGSVLVVAAVASISANAATQAVCGGGSAGDGSSFASGSNFVKVGFTPKCSANVVMNGEDASATLFRVGAVSVKGKTRFGGSSVGGSVGNQGVCSNTPCDSSDATAGLNAAPSS